MSGMYDFRRNMINKEILKILGLTEEFFPIIEKATRRGELISKKIQNLWKVNNRFPVFLCGNDQGASASGVGLNQAGSVNINFGTAMVFYTLLDSLATDLTGDQISGKHPIGDDYFLLNFESDFGIQIRRLKEIFFKHSSYDQFFQTYNQYPNVDEQIPLKKDVDLSFNSEGELYRFCAGIIKYYLNRLQFHLAQIRKSVQVKKITLSGGMIISEVWRDILGSILDPPVTVSNRANSGLLGALYIYLNNKKEENL
jgi:sugar (pentulose or hexulose) kinase